MDPGLSEVTEEEEEVVEVRAARVRAQRALTQRAPAHNGYSLEYMCRLSDMIPEHCTDEEFERVIPSGSSRTYEQIIRWARREADVSPDPATKVRWLYFVYP